MTKYDRLYAVCHHSPNLIFVVIKFHGNLAFDYIKSKAKFPCFLKLHALYINMTGCIEVGDHDPSIHKNETEIKPHVICCRNFDTYIS